MVLLDGYDITNKAILCNPSFNTRTLEWFQNDYDRLKIVPDNVWPQGMNGMVGESRSPSMTPQTSPSVSALPFSQNGQEQRGQVNKQVVNQQIVNQRMAAPVNVQQANWNKYKVPSQSTGSRVPSPQLNQFSILPVAMAISAEQTVDFMNWVTRRALDDLPYFKHISESIRRRSVMHKP